MKTKGIIIGAALVLLLPAVALAQYNATAQDAKSAVAGNPSFSKNGIATGKAELARDIRITAGPAGAVAESQLRFTFSVDLANDDAGGINVDLATGNWTLGGGTAAITVDKDKGIVDLNITAGNAGEFFVLRGVRVLANTATGDITATIRPQVNAITVDGLPSNQVTVMSPKDGIKVTVDDTAELLAGGLELDDTAVLKIKEEFDDVFKSQGQAEGQGNENETTNGVEILASFSIPSGVELKATLSGVTGAEWVGDDNVITFKTADTSKVIEFVGAAPDTDLGDDETLTVTIEVTKAPSDLAVGNIDFGFTLSPASSVPAFDKKETTVTAVRVLPGVTNLLIPLVISSPPFDTGIQVGNTSADPFGAAEGAVAQSGTVTFHFWPNDGSASFSYTTGAGSPGVGLSATGEVVSGGTYTVLASELLSAAGFAGSFTGYVFAIAGFTHAHGAGFISDFANFTQGTPALIVPPVELTSRKTQAFESLGN